VEASAQDSYAGGIVGTNNGIIEDVYFWGHVTGIKVEGIAGFNTGDIRRTYDARLKSGHRVENATIKRAKIEVSEDE